MLKKEASQQEKQYYTTLEEKVKSGDYINACIPNQFPKQLKTFKGFMFMFDQIAKDKELNSTDKTILFYMLGNVGFENWINITQQQMSDDLNIKRQQITRSIKKLQLKEIVFLEKVGRNNFYKMNPEFVWRGKTSEWKKIVDIEQFKKKQDKQYINHKMPF